MLAASFRHTASPSACERGMAVYFDAPGTKNDLLDRLRANQWVSLITKPFLRAQGVNRLSDIALTHGDVHHVGGAKLLVDLFSVKRVWVSPVRFVLRFIDG
jgi:beta-lactamase superfamily II metal-dependent hydrolase